MIPSAFLVAVAFLWCSFVVQCNVPSPCDATVKCANNMTVCENGFCQIQADQVCTIETTTTVATTVTTTGTTSQASSSSSATTTTVATTTTTTPTTNNPENGTGHVRVTELVSVMVTTVLLFLI